MATVGETPTLFLRKATGLVKGWSRRDAFIYSFMSVNLITLGLYFAFSVLAFVPNGQVLPAVIISGVLITFLVITYAGLISAMPRAGGDYVWQSRVLGGGIAFVLAVTGWWFILWHWAPIYANILSVEVLQPLFAIFKWTGAVTWLGTHNGIFITSVRAPASCAGSGPVYSTNSNPSVPIGFSVLIAAAGASCGNGPMTCSLKWPGDIPSRPAQCACKERCVLLV